MNTFGRFIRLTTFGESHGPAIGGILDGMPPGILIDLEEVQAALNRRRPGRGPGMSQRREEDKVEVLSGLTSDFKTLGTPIGFIIRNTDSRPQDYENYAKGFRPNHADYTYYKKYGIPPQSGGGRASARETANWVTAGALAGQWLANMGIQVKTNLVLSHDVLEVQSSGDSCGGTIEGEILGLPVGLGEPVFDKFHSRLASAMMGINAAKAFEYGDGFRSADALGSESLDIFIPRNDEENICFSNHSGGVQGGITNGMPVNFKVYFKPTPTIGRPVESIDLSGDKITLDAAGRHDPCVAVRAVPVVEAMALLVTADFIRAPKNDPYFSDMNF